ncbi:MAG: peptide chain release factor 2 [Gammaproteobacteria bacterium RIFCSPHIGHO2_12_FULL_42_13]|nr:MAG: peptide chain release factor 2 [Gammaproteobacteria bacterium RIFCSPHIGHO2_12_FULL_42_13]
MNPFGGRFDFDAKKHRLIEVRRELEDPAIWNYPEKAQALGKERAQLEKNVEILDALSQRLIDAKELLDLDDSSLLKDIQNDVSDIEKQVDQLEFQRMFSGEMDPHNAYLEIQSGSGGTEAQDWAEMLLRMYLRFANQHNFRTTIESISAGEVAGIKHATVYVEGEYAFGWLRTETGVHRLVRKSPFDSGNRRHTSFASVFVSPEIDDDIQIDLNPADIRTDTFRASGAGGQHVNKTDSAIRMTHIPTGIVVQCQSDRSQHKNRSSALKQLKAKLYELEMQKKQEKQAAIEDTKMDISWGSQIRSYVLDQSRVKDLRSGVETTDTQRVLDGDLDRFIEAMLKQQ